MQRSPAAEVDVDDGATEDWLSGPVPKLMLSIAAVSFCTFWYQAYPGSVVRFAASGMVETFQFSLCMMPHELMKALTLLSESSCSRMTRPGDLGSL